MLLQRLVELAIFTSIVGSVKRAEGKDFWDYTPEFGPSKWAEKWPVCNGTRQSPIDIRTSMAETKNLGNIKLNNYDTVPSGVNFTAKNNGHTFSVSMAGYTSETVPTISEGGLPGTFKLAGFHFHWGNDSTRGSEHQKDGNSYPAELHLVHQNTKYSKLTDAIGESDGLAVLGIFMKEGNSNPVFNNFLDMTKYNVINPDTTAKVTAFELMSFLPSNKTFYRYLGSLTTPQCQESVTWTVFENSIDVSAQQLAEFRKMKYNNNQSVLTPLVDTYRPPQSLKGRQIFVHYDSKTPTTGGNVVLMLTSVLFVILPLLEI